MHQAITTLNMRFAIEIPSGVCSSVQKLKSCLARMRASMVRKGAQLQQWSVLRQPPHPNPLPR